MDIEEEYGMHDSHPKERSEERERESGRNELSLLRKWPPHLEMLLYEYSVYTIEVSWPLLRDTPVQYSRYGRRGRREYCRQWTIE